MASVVLEAQRAASDSGEVLKGVCTFDASMERAAAHGIALKPPCPHQFTGAAALFPLARSEILAGYRIGPAAAGAGAARGRWDAY